MSLYCKKYLPNNIAKVPFKISIRAVIAPYFQPSIIVAFEAPELFDPPLLMSIPFAIFPRV